MVPSRMRAQQSGRQTDATTNAQVQFTYRGAGQSLQHRRTPVNGALLETRT